MKTLISLFAILLLFSLCKPASKDEAEEATVSGSELLNAYADSLVIVSDSLEVVYNNMISQIARDPSKFEEVEAANKPAHQELNARMIQLNNMIGELIQSKKITDEEYEAVALDLDLSGPGHALDKLNSLGVDFN